MEKEFNLVIETKEGVKISKQIKCPICNETVFCLIDDEGEYKPYTHDKQCSTIFKKQKKKEK